MRKIFDHDLKTLESLFGAIYDVQDIYKDSIETQRLLLKKEAVVDCISVQYGIFSKGTREKMGKVILLYDGEICCEIDKPHRNKEYATEAIAVLMENSKKREFYFPIDYSNIAARKVAIKLSFVFKFRSGRALIYTKTRRSEK